MKTTIDIPEPLYGRAKIRAVETVQTLSGPVLTALERSLESPETADESQSHWANRKLRFGYAAALAADALTRFRDSSVIISEDRSSREMVYFDSSYLFRVYSQESGHEAVKGLLPTSGGIASALHARSELTSILVRHRREQSVVDELLVGLHEQFRDECRAGHIL